MMAVPNTAQPDTLADVKDEARPFNEKLKRVLKDRPAKDLAERLGISVQTVYGWKARGYQPAAHQLPIVAKFARCSLDYLCDNDIPVEADPTSGAKFPQPLGETPLPRIMKFLAERYVQEAAELLCAIEEVEKADWRSIAEAVVADGIDGIDSELFETIAVALHAYQVGPRISIYDPSSVLWIASHLKKYPSIKSEELDMYALRRRWRRASASSIFIDLIVAYACAGDKSPEEKEVMRSNIQMMLDEYGPEGDDASE